MIQGPFTNELNNPGNRLGTDLIKGEEIIIEYIEPISSRGKSRLHINKVIHGYKDMFPNGTRDFGDSWPCHIDITCPQGEGWDKESKSVALILWEEYWWGTGFLINNTCNYRNKPYFLTALHVVDNGDGIIDENERSHIQEMIYRFLYKNPTCGGSTPPSNYYTYTGGATFQAGWFDSDFCLLKFNTFPSEVLTYAGWSRNTNPSEGTGIHHPVGDVMKIAIDDDPLTMGKPDDTPFPPNHFWKVYWDEGVTQNGSSGSPLFNQNHQAIGQLNGGESNCQQNGPDYYGRFDLSWNGPSPYDPEKSLKSFLDPKNTNFNSVNSTTGDPSVSGPDFVCYGSQSIFTLKNYWSDELVVNWSSTPSNLLNPSSGTGKTFTTQAKYSTSKGYVTIKASFFNPCTQSVRNYTKQIYVGRPYYSGGTELYGFPDVICKPFYSIEDRTMFFCGERTALTVPGAEEYIWDIFPHSRYFQIYPNPNYVETNVEADIDVPYGDYNIYTYSRNQCGYGTMFVGMFSVTQRDPWGNCSEGGGGFYRMTIAPNPPDDYCEIIIEETGDPVAKSEDYIEEFEFIVFNSYGLPVFRIKTREKKIRLDTSKLPEGFYYIHLIYPEGIEKAQILVRHD